MSYKCDKCNTVRYGSELKITSDVRKVNYIKSIPQFDRKENRMSSRYDSTYTGTENVRELKLCEGCFEIFKDNTPRLSKQEKDVHFVGKRTDKEEEKDTNVLSFGNLREKFENKRS